MPFVAFVLGRCFGETKLSQGRRAAECAAPNPGGRHCCQRIQLAGVSHKRFVPKWNVSRVQPLVQSSNASHLHRPFTIRAVKHLVLT